MTEDERRKALSDRLKEMGLIPIHKEIAKKKKTNFWTRRRFW